MVMVVVICMKLGCKLHICWGKGGKAPKQNTVLYPQYFLNGRGAKILYSFLNYMNLKLMLFNGRVQCQVTHNVGTLGVGCLTNELPIDKSM